MKILVTGSKGQLGSEIKELSTVDRLLSTDDFIFTDIDELDITDFSALEKFVEFHKPDQIINCAAYTAVDKAETDVELAEKINVKACSNLAKLCYDKGIFLIHVSTDYVFDGNNFKPYKETDPTNPVSVYGKTKLEGELQIKQIYQIKEESLNLPICKCIILRTSWLYSSFGNNFIKSMIKYGTERGKLNVVYDQVGSPTYARDLAKAILEIIKSTVDCRPSTVDIYNYSNEGVCSWYDFAKTIIELKNINCVINAIETKDYPTPAKRPHYSVLSKEKIKADFKINIPYWRDSLIDCLELIK